MLELSAPIHTTLLICRWIVQCHFNFQRLVARSNISVSYCCWREHPYGHLASKNSLDLLYITDQWRSQALKLGWAERIWGRKSPSGVRGGAQVGVCMGAIGRTPRSHVINRQLAVWNAFLRRFVAESVFRLPPTLPKKLPGSARILRPKTTEAGWERAHPWLYATVTDRFIGEFKGD